MATYLLPRDNKARVSHFQPLRSCLITSSSLFVFRLAVICSVLSLFANFIFFFANIACYIGSNSVSPKSNFLLLLIIFINLADRLFIVHSSFLLCPTLDGSPIFKSLRVAQALHHWTTSSVLSKFSTGPWDNPGASSPYSWPHRSRASRLFLRLSPPPILPQVSVQGCLCSQGECSQLPVCSWSPPSHLHFLSKRFHSSSGKLMFLTLYHSVTLVPRLMGFVPLSPALLPVSSLLSRLFLVF